MSRQLGQFADESQPFSPVAEAVAAERQALLDVADDPLEGLLLQVREEIPRLGLTPADLDNPDETHLQAVEDLVRHLVEERQARIRRGEALLDVDASTAVQVVLDAVFGFGPITTLLRDETVEEVFCNGPSSIWVIDTQGKRRTPYCFRSAAQLVEFVRRAVAHTGRTIDRSKPYLDAKLKDGSRLHAIMDPLVDGLPIAVTIRRHRLVARTLADLVHLGTVTPEVAKFLRAAVRGRLNIVVSGATASGKTNFLNALSAEIPPDERVVTIEDTPELQLTTLDDWVALVVRRPGEEIAEIGQDILVMQTLRMRPDRIITGETRGPEVVYILEAANTGHDGQMLTVHANSAQDVITRLETLYLRAGRDVPTRAIRQMISSAFHLVVQLQRHYLPDGRQVRRVMEIAELTGRMEGNAVEIAPLFKADEATGENLAWTGQHPRCAKTINDRGYAFDFGALVQGGSSWGTSPDPTKYTRRGGGHRAR